MGRTIRQSKLVRTGLLFAILVGVLGMGLNARNSLCFTLTNIGPSGHAPIYLVGNAAVDQYFAGNGTDGLSWATADVMQNLQINANQQSSAITIINSTRYIQIGNVSCSFAEESSKNIPGYPPMGQYAGIDLEGCQNVNISDAEISTCDFGIYAFTCSNLTMSNIAISSSNSFGLWLDHTSYCNIQQLLVANSGESGILMQTDDNDNTFQQVLVQNAPEGLSCYSSNSNIFSGLELDGFWYGVYLNNANSNRFANLQFEHGYSFPKGDFGPIAVNVTISNSNQNDFGNYAGSIVVQADMGPFLPSIGVAGGIIGGIVIIWAFIIRARVKAQHKLESQANSIREGNEND